MRFILILVFISVTAACSQKVSPGKTEQKFGPCKQTTDSSGRVEQSCGPFGQEVER
jgi:hypothetical protein